MSEAPLGSSGGPGERVEEEEVERAIKVRVSIKCNQHLEFSGFSLLLSACFSILQFTRNTEYSRGPGLICLKWSVVIFFLTVGGEHGISRK